MALPLLLVGSALGAVFLANEREKRHQLELKRRSGTVPVPQGNNKHVGLHPSLWQAGHKRVNPLPGTIICCFVYGVIEHTGIWLDDHTLIELHGNFLKDD